MTYQRDFDKRIRLGLVGVGSHAYRNILPALHYLPVTLCAISDPDTERAARTARQFGVAGVYASASEMYARESLDAVIICVSERLHPQLACEAFSANLHVWMEKPQSGRPERIEELMRLSDQAGKLVMVGYKKIFFPAIAKAKEIMARPEFGAFTSCYGRYPQGLPPYEQRSDGRRMIGFLDHIVHPMSILYYLGGPFRSIRFMRESRRGATITLIQFVSGGIGALHLTSGQSGTSPLERVEVIGEGANLVVDNGVNLTYYRPGSRGAYGRAPSFLVPDDQAPLVWTPEFSLGQLYNKNLFTLGYAQEVRHFAQCVLEGRPLDRADLTMALEMAKVFQAYLAPDGEEVLINP